MQCANTNTKGRDDCKPTDMIILKGLLVSDESSTSDESPIFEN